MRGLASLQSPPQDVYPSPSASNPSSIVMLQLSSMPLQISVAPGWTCGLASLQSPPQEVQPSPSASNPSSTASLQSVSVVYPSPSASIPPVVTAIRSSYEP